jgi:hypothetical protein
MPSGQRPRNRLLQALPEADYEALRPHLEVAVGDTTLVEAGAALTQVYLPQVYLPHAGAVSMVVNLSEGQAVEVAMIGRDSVVGASTALVDGISLSDLVVLIPGVTVTPISRPVVKCRRVFFWQRQLPNLFCLFVESSG